jgi:hypothetical protein
MIALRIRSGRWKSEGKIMRNSKFWNWSELRERLSGFFSIGLPLPDELLSDSDYEKKTRASFMAGREIFFSPIREAQPLVWEQLMKFSDVAVVQNKKHPTLVDIAVISGERFLFAEPFSYSDDDEYWREINSYLPDFLQSYYVNFNGMRGSRYKPSCPGNLPANNRKWRRISDFAKEEGVPKRDLSNLKKNFVELDSLFIFLETDWSDLVFLDFGTPSKKIYIVPERKFSEYFELPDAGHQIDKLCSHVLSGATEPFRLRKI